MAALIETLAVGKVGIVAHDVGAAVAQALARRSPDQLAGLFFFGFIYPGIGTRFTAPDRLQNVWFMFFHQSDVAPALTGPGRARDRRLLQSSRTEGLGRLSLAAPAAGIVAINPAAGRSPAPCSPPPG